LDKIQDKATLKDFSKIGIGKTKESFVSPFIYQVYKNFIETSTNPVEVFRKLQKYLIDSTSL